MTISNPHLNDGSYKPSSFDDSEVSQEFVQVCTNFIEKFPNCQNKSQFDYNSELTGEN